MRVYVARQPIFTKNMTVFGYELFYRDSEVNAYNPAMDGNRATRAVISDVMTVFGLENVTEGRLAFVNLTYDLLVQGFIYMTRRNDVVIEVLESVQFDDRMLECLRDLRQQGYSVALDDYTGDARHDPFLAEVDIVKIDFLQTGVPGACQLARVLKDRYPTLKLLAEKIESREAFELAKKAGFTLFQGYYFSRPQVMMRTTPSVTGATCLQMLTALSRPGVSYNALADIVRHDVTLTYRLLSRSNTLQYYRQRRVTNVKTALVCMGLREIKRWFLLLFMRDSACLEVDELVRTALVRGMFCERLCSDTALDNLAEDAFTTGMFSLLETILNDNIDHILNDLSTSAQVRRALLGEPGPLTELLAFVVAYEEARWDDAEALLETLDLDIDLCQAADCYREAVSYADLAFQSSASTAPVV